mmetsp:Transcript_28139/g.45196  ORF Transcript_28139/g.45196 Transcript_28139/m.45196 type:complete len:86 (-) Transcript_28139:32-289(-)
MEPKNHGLPPKDAMGLGDRRLCTPKGAKQGSRAAPGYLWGWYRCPSPYGPHMPQGHSDTGAGKGDGQMTPYDCRASEGEENHPTS